MRSLVKYGSVALVLKLLVASAQAASLLPSSDDELNPISWSGFIIAPYFGYETLNLNGAGSAGLGDPKGWRVGGELDYDYQIGNFVVGIAGDAFYTWYDSNGSGPQNGINTRLSDYETVRARLGYTFGRWMLFGTGGVAFGDLEIKNALSGVSAEPDAHGMDRRRRRRMGLEQQPHAAGRGRTHRLRLRKVRQLADAKSGRGCHARPLQNRLRYALLKTEPGDGPSPSLTVHAGISTGPAALAGKRSRGALVAQAQQPPECSVVLR